MDDAVAFVGLILQLPEQQGLAAALNPIGRVEAAAVADELDFLAEVGKQDDEVVIRKTDVDESSVGHGVAELEMAFPVKDDRIEEDVRLGCLFTDIDCLARSIFEGSFNNDIVPMTARSDE